jgi:hypothetical protein
MLMRQQDNTVQSQLALNMEEQIDHTEVELMSRSTVTNQN